LEAAALANSSDGICAQRHVEPFFFSDGRSWISAMLSKTSVRVEICLQRATECAELASRSRDPERRELYFRMEMRWMRLAGSFEFLDGLKAFATDQEHRRRQWTSSGSEDR
jgi:hypothetical protein